MPPRLKVTSEALLQELFPDRHELLKDRKLMGHVRDCIDSVQNEVIIGKIGLGRAEEEVRIRVQKGANRYLKYLEVRSYPTTMSAKAVGEITRIPKSTVTRWRNGDAPAFASDAFQSSHGKRKAVNRGAVANSVLEQALRWLKTSTAASDVLADEEVLQLIVYIDMADNFIDAVTVRDLRRLGLSAYEALVYRLVDMEIQNGRGSLIIDKYKAPLALWMFNAHGLEKFDIQNRTQAVATLYDALGGRFPSREEFTTAHNTLMRSFDAVRRKMRELYGVGTLWAAYAELWMINAFNYEDVRKSNPTMHLSFEHIVDINKRAVREIVHSGVRVPEIAETLHLPEDVVKAIIGPNYKDRLERQLAAVQKRFQHRSKTYKDAIPLQVVDRYFDGTEHSESYLIGLAKELDKPVSWFQDMERLTTVLRGRYSVYLN